jgi:alkylated DNA repair protein alkB homolog 7
MVRVTLVKKATDLIFFHKADKWPVSFFESMKQSIAVIPEFITEDEEKCLLQEIEPHMKRLRYEESHWDDAIHTYREREQKKWNPANEKVLERIATTSFPEDALHLSYIHILDLHKNGYIKPHIDSVRVSW